VRRQQPWVKVPHLHSYYWRRSPHKTWQFDAFFSSLPHKKTFQKINQRWVGQKNQKVMLSSSERSFLKEKSACMGSFWLRKRYIQVQGGIWMTCEAWVFGKNQPKGQASQQKSMWGWHHLHPKALEIVARNIKLVGGREGDKNWIKTTVQNDESALTRRSKNKECWAARTQQWRTKNKR